MNRHSIFCAIGALALLAFPAAAASTHPASHHPPIRDRWPAENLSGRISMVEPDKKLVFVQDSSGTMFEFEVPPKTRILDGARHLTVGDLAAKSNQPVTVRYIPERKGDVASTIELKH